jgi:nucleoside 2-deoxyribosyltransferase
MNKDGRFETAISGSFKFKPEIDSMREAFADNNITVIAPDEGWLYIPKLVVSGSKNQFRPLPTEQGMTVREIEDRFIASIKESDFLFVMNVDGYFGLSTALEMGFAESFNKPIYALQEVDYTKCEIDELWLIYWLKENLNIVPIDKIHDHYMENYYGKKDIYKQSEVNWIF